MRRTADSHAEGMAAEGRMNRTVKMGATPAPPVSGGLYVCSAVGDICDSSSQPGSFPTSVAIDSPSAQSYPDQEPKSQNLE